MLETKRSSNIRTLEEPVGEKGIRDAEEVRNTRRRRAQAESAALSVPTEEALHSITDHRKVQTKETASGIPERWDKRG